MPRSTKIVATLGPASSDPQTLERMFLAGVDIVRMNFSHGTAADHERRAELVREACRKTGRTVGGIPFTRGPLAHFLRNRFYIGEVVFKGEVFPGEQPAILDRDLFDAVQAKLNDQMNNHTAARAKSDSLLPLDCKPSIRTDSSRGTVTFSSILGLRPPTCGFRRGGFFRNCSLLHHRDTNAG